MKHFLIIALISLAAFNTFAANTISEMEEQAQNGSSEYQFKLGFVYEQGIGSAEKDLDKAKEYYSQAAENGVSESYARLGEIEKEQGDMDAAVQYWRTGADAQDELSKAYMGRYYFNQGKYYDANPLLKSAAIQGIPEAQYYLSKIYEQGRIGAKNIVYAHAWMSIAARNSDKAQSEKNRMARSMTQSQISASKRISDNFVDKYFN